MSEKEEIIIQPGHVNVMKFVEKFIEKKQYAPDGPEIGKAVDLSPRQVWRILDDLEVLGYISKKLRTKRSIKILKSMSPE